MTPGRPLRHLPLLILIALTALAAPAQELADALRALQRPAQPTSPTVTKLAKQLTTATSAQISAILQDASLPTAGKQTLLLAISRSTNPQAVPILLAQLPDSHGTRWQPQLHYALYHASSPDDIPALAQTLDTTPDPQPIEALIASLGGEPAFTCLSQRYRQQPERRDHLHDLILQLANRTLHPQITTLLNDDDGAMQTLGRDAAMHVLGWQANPQAPPQQLHAELIRALAPPATPQHHIIDKDAQQRLLHLYRQLADDPQPATITTILDDPAFSAALNHTIHHQLPLTNPDVQTVFRARSIDLPAAQLDACRDLLPDLTGADSNRRAKALLRLKDFADVALLPVFLQMLDDPVSQVREDALDSIYLLFEEDEELAKSWYKEVIRPAEESDNDVNRHFGATPRSWSRGSWAKDAAPLPFPPELLLQPVRRLLDDINADVQIAAIQTLTALHDTAAYPRITDLALAANLPVQMAALDAIAQRDIRTAFPALRQLLADRDWRLRARAARVYFEMGVETAEERAMLTEALRHEQDAYVRAELQQLALQPGHDASGMPRHYDPVGVPPDEYHRLRRQFLEADGEERFAAATALLDIRYTDLSEGAPGEIPTIELLRTVFAEHPDPAFRQEWLEWAIGETGTTHELKILADLGEDKILAELMRYKNPIRRSGDRQGAIEHLQRMLSSSNPALVAQGMDMALQFGDNEALQSQALAHLRKLDNEQLLQWLRKTSTYPLRDNEGLIALFREWLNGTSPDRAAFAAVALSELTDDFSPADLAERQSIEALQARHPDFFAALAKATTIDALPPTDIPFEFKLIAVGLEQSVHERPEPPLRDHYLQLIHKLKLHDYAYGRAIPRWLDEDATAITAYCRQFDPRIPPEWLVTVAPYLPIGYLVQQLNLHEDEGENHWSFVARHTLPQAPYPKLRRLLRELSKRNIRVQIDISDWRQTESTVLEQLANDWERLSEHERRIVAPAFGTKLSLLTADHARDWIINADISSPWELRHLNLGKHRQHLVSWIQATTEQPQALETILQAISNLHLRWKDDELDTLTQLLPRLAPTAQLHLLAILRDHLLDSPACLDTYTALLDHPDLQQQLLLLRSDTWDNHDVYAMHLDFSDPEAAQTPDEPPPVDAALQASRNALRAKLLHIIEDNKHPNRGVAFSAFVLTLKLHDAETLLRLAHTFSPDYWGHTSPADLHLTTIPLAAARLILPPAPDDPRPHAHPFSPEEYAQLSPALTEDAVAWLRQHYPDMTDQQRPVALTLLTTHLRGNDIPWILRENVPNNRQLHSDFPDQTRQAWLDHLRHGGSLHDTRYLPLPDPIGDDLHAAILAHLPTLTDAQLLLHLPTLYRSLGPEPALIARHLPMLDTPKFHTLALQAIPIHATPETAPDPAKLHQLFAKARAHMPDLPHPHIHRRLLPLIADQLNPSELFAQFPEGYELYEQRDEYLAPLIQSLKNAPPEEISTFITTAAKGDNISTLAHMLPPLELNANQQQAALTTIQTLAPELQGHFWRFLDGQITEVTAPIAMRALAANYEEIDLDALMPHILTTLDTGTLPTPTLAALLEHDHFTPQMASKLDVATLPIHALWVLARHDHFTHEMATKVDAILPTIDDEEELQYYLYIFKGQDRYYPHQTAILIKLLNSDNPQQQNFASSAAARNPGQLADNLPPEAQALTDTINQALLKDIQNQPDFPIHRLDTLGGLPADTRLQLINQHKDRIIASDYPPLMLLEHLPPEQAEPILKAIIDEGAANEHLIHRWLTQTTYTFPWLNDLKEEYHIPLTPHPQPQD